MTSPSGRYSSYEGITRWEDCEPCPAGFHNYDYGSTDSSACIPCTEGFEAPEGSGVCEPCQPGYIAPDDMTESCQSCPGGRYSTAWQGTECNPCEAGFFCPEGSSTQQPCVAGSISDNEQDYCDPCERDFYQSQTGQSECVECPEGNECIDVLGTTTPVPCEPGYFDAGDYCELCAESTYSDTPMTTVCTPCPASRVSAAGAISEDGCVNPLPNFILGYLSLGVVCITIFIYVSNGRFHRVAFIRKYRALNLIYFEARNVSHELAVKMKEHGLKEHVKIKHSGILRTLLVIIWIALTTALIGTVVITVYILLLSRVLFASLLIWKGFNVGNIGFVDKLNDVADALSVSLSLPELGSLMYPFIKFIDILSYFKIDLGSVEVTCEGSQAPMELIINCFVLGFSVIIIESDFHIYQNIIFANVNMKMAKALATFNLGIENPKTLAMRCAFAYVVSVGNPLVKILQFAMSTLNFSSFVRYSYIMHRWTAPCDEIEGMEGMDSTLAIITSLLAWYVLFPAVYTLAKVVVPCGDNVPARYKNIERDELHVAERKKFDKAHKKKAPITGLPLSAHGKKCPDAYLNHLTSEEFEEIVLMFNEIDDSGDGEVDEKEVTDIFFKLGFVQSEEKTRKWFNEADKDGNGSIDFNEFVGFIVSVKKEDAGEFDFFLSSFGHTTKNCGQRFMSVMKASSFVMPDLIAGTVDALWLNKLINRIGGKYRFSHKSIIWSPYRKGTPDEFAAWVKRNDDSMPTYFVLCHIVYLTMMQAFMSIVGTGNSAWIMLIDLPFIKKIPEVLAFIVAYLLPGGHIFSSCGRAMWWIVAKKIYIYILVCLGVWTDDCVVGYDLENESKLRIKEDIDASADSMEDHSEHDDATLLTRMNSKHDFAVNEDYKKMKDSWEDEMGESVRMLIAPRAVLLQIFPFLTFLSIYADISSDAPLFILSERATRYFPALFIKDSLLRARITEMNEANHKLSARARGVEWTIQARAVNIFCTESRFFKIIRNLCQFFMVIAILYSNDPAPILLMSLILLFPLIFVTLLDVYVFTGKAIGITDDDLILIFRASQGPAPGSGIDFRNNCLHC